MRPPVRPPQLRCVFFSSMYLPHLLVLPATFWTSVPFATLSVFPSLICGSCPSGQRFAYSFFQIPSHGGHPCCSAMCFVVAYAHLGLSPIRKRPCWANKIPRTNPYGLSAGLTLHIIFRLYYIENARYPGKLHNALSQHSLNHLLKSGDISTSHIVARNLIALCCL